jgi:uncharacterized protein YfaS (alpha-2-macroglobulin family)
VHLGLALKLMGDEARARAPSPPASQAACLNNAWWGDYGSNLRDWALIYVLLDKHQLTPAGREDLSARSPAKSLRTAHISTQEKLALFLLGRSFANQTAREWRGNFCRQARRSRSAARARSSSPVATERTGAGVTIRNTHKERLFVELNFAGNPALRCPPRGATPSISSATGSPPTASRSASVHCASAKRRSFACR